MLRGSADLAEFILANYAGKVVEVGSGRMTDVAERLSGLLLVVITDKKENPVPGMIAVADDIFSPRVEIYAGASLLYAIRPPLEMQMAMGNLARSIGADIIVRPLDDEVADLPCFKRRLVNSGEARFYLFRRL
jgi:hypothetical protein